MSKRKLRVFGHCIDAIGTVTVNGTVVHQGKFNEPCLYEFETDTTLHGHVDVSIELLQGVVSINRVDAVYPAMINNSCQGWYVFKQPVDNPFINPDTKESFLLPVKIIDKLFYKHLMFNGPKEVKVTINQPINLVDGVEVHESLVDYIKGHWGYDPIEWNRAKLLNW